jgi:integrase
VLAAIDAQQYVTSGSLSFDSLCDRYLAACNTRVEQTTKRWYERNFKNHLRPILGPMKLGQIKPIHVQNLLDGAKDTSRCKKKVGSSLSASSKKNLLVAIRAVFAWAVRMELMAKNPAIAVSLPKTSKRDYPDFNSSVLNSLFGAIIGTEFEVIARFALLTGVRRGEIVALQWKDVDLQRGRFSIRRSAATLDGEQIIKSPKTLRSNRTEALPPTLIALLQRHRKQQARRYDEIGLGLPTHESLVFDREDGSAWNVNELSRRWSRFVRAKKLPAMRWHDLRHGFASISHESGESMHSIMTAMGHSSIAVTSSTYVHLFDETKKRRAGRLDQFLTAAIRDTNVTNEDLPENEAL